MTTPCSENPNRWLQPGETRTWLGATWAKHACRTQCDRLTQCAQDALTAGALADQDQDTRPRVASGGIWAGVQCRGDVETHQLLSAIAYPDGPAPQLNTACIGCERVFIASADDTDDTVHRATPNSPFCRGCYSTAARAGYRQPLRLVIPDICPGCDEPMTTRNNPKPGHVRHERGGYCRNCVRARKDTAA